MNFRFEVRVLLIFVFYVLDELYLDSIFNIFYRDSIFRGCLDGCVYDEFEGDFRRSFYIVMDN